MEGDNVMTASQALRDNFQPDAIDRIFKQVGKFMTYKRTDQTIEKFLMEFGICLVGRKSISVRRKAAPQICVWPFCASRRPNSNRVKERC